MQEIEDPTPVTGGVTGMMGSEGSGWVTAVVSAVSTVVLTLLGLAFKRGRSTAAVEDAQNEVSVETIVSQRARIKELEEQVKLLLTDNLVATRAQLTSEMQAERAAAQAQLAHEAAERAQQAAQNALAEATEAKRLSGVRKAYIVELVERMRAAGMEIPAEPV